MVKLSAGSTDQTVLPFTGLNQPSGVAVDRGGSVYITDWNNRVVLKLPAGSNTQSVLPFTGLISPGGVALDAARTVYVTDNYHNRVVTLAGQ